jgi:hypothetical protein
MTDSQIGAAAARCWIDAETPVRRPRSNEWTKLGEVAPAERIVEDKDIDTSAMILLSGEFEIVDDDAAPSKDELATARPPRLAPKLFVVALAMLAGGGLLARGRVPRLDAEVDAIVSAMRPAPLPTPTHVAAIPAAAAPVAAPAPMTVTSSASLTLVPKMPAPVPKMREPARMEPKPVVSAKAKAKSHTRRH